ncbi:Gfo/Idh/MocA family protein [Paenibacillus apiarius]|uniref:Gfo/Idh/MocA family oxidoreductase n=1 Tax=Paenibacillus apiarius TaxID=46240 RepID=A0ABT4DX82_9BACL|nr:Gfo/Idh/MocA family oxidoreductase [Paenibacillus apiarius]MCY9515695.1 Gfo/Idh/MocA family oxidoreductase [Paenibacillus apiarius]MCY9521972.1 Gfo/Idh/MocA family oxidoreductase [Paenibacillus apiarius]MCY9550518.1 Gfo/Idh/MocA family oxidoreductase [Paenibacillus apiarius]MCY9559833.1 Gfo/Idh/MocA family oxidoreductase [Paenibacillus apiarius]MCY9683483.1 Gfo/Idh/MocA family oxidoreductase [Paenibacillus apiarius]
MHQVTAIVIGAGDRGARAYAPYALDNMHEVKIVGVADPNMERRRSFAEAFGLPESQQYDSWEAILGEKRMADAAIVCTQDRMHYEPTLRALELGYHVLLEKPMSPEPKECVEMELAAKRHNRLLTICHVLRYTPFWTAMKREIERGAIGDIISIQLNENVGNMHMSHSFVRGNWRNSDQSSPMILQKSCHDMDILAYLMNEPCVRLNSFGSLMHFHEGNKPEGAPARCIEGCPAEAGCQYHAPRYYLGEGIGWARKITDDYTKEGIVKALWEGPYGKCVYQTDNNVVDHQVVNMEFASGATAMFSMCGFTHDNTRIVQVMGTKGDIRGNMEDDGFVIHDFVTKEERTIKVHTPETGHGGGDSGIVRAFLQEVRSFGQSGSAGESLSSASVSVRSHLMAFAAEKSRLNGGQAIDLQAMYDELAGQPSA